jgi:hypothetical protein
MQDTRLQILLAISLVVLIGTIYSVLNQTYLDTSHPFNEPSSPFACNPLLCFEIEPAQCLFHQKAWAWTSGAFFVLWITSTPSSRVVERVGRWILETAVWLVFTIWFFGPAVIERVIVASGGECILYIPEGNHILVPTEYCFTKSPISPATHPSLFAGTSTPLAQLTLPPYHVYEEAMTSLVTSFSLPCQLSSWRTNCIFHCKAFYMELGAQSGGDNELGLDFRMVICVLDHECLFSFATGEVDRVP